MSIALVKIDNKIIEIIGKQYIHLSKIEENNKEEIKVIKPIQSHKVQLYSQEVNMTIIKDVQKEIYYYNNVLKISNNDKNFKLRNLNDDEYIKVDGTKQSIINNSSIKIYKNYRLVKEEEFIVNQGDIVHFEDIFSITIKEEKRLEISVYQKNLITNNLPSMKGIIKEYKDFPIYTNSPKMNYVLEEEQISLQGPPEKEKVNKAKVIVKKVLPPLVTMTLTLILAYFKPRGPYIIISMTATIMTLTFSITSYIEEKKENKIFNAKRKEIYDNYLYETRTKLTELKEEEITIRNYKYLSDDRIIKEIKNNSSRLYERAITDEDFLKLRIGLIDDEPTYKITCPIDKLQIDKSKEELEVEELYDDFKILENMPRVVSALANNIGLIGSKSIVKEQVKSMLLQTIFFHSYLDVKIVYIINKEELRDYDTYKYVKHSQIGEDNLYNYIYDNQTRDVLLSPIVQMFRSREEANKEKKQSGGLPIFIFVISNYDLIANHGIMEFLQKDAREYGFSLMFMTDRKENLIDNIDTVLEYKNKYIGEVVIENNIVKHEEFKIEDINLGSELI